MPEKTTAGQIKAAVEFIDMAVAHLLDVRLCINEDRGGNQSLAFEIRCQINDLREAGQSIRDCFHPINAKKYGLEPDLEFTEQ